MASRHEVSTLFGLATTLVGVVGTLALIISLAMALQPAQAAPKHVICYASVSSMLVPLAKSRDLYSAEGLNIELRSFPSGRQALEAVFSGECSLATVADPPVAHYSLSRNDFQIIATISLSNNFAKMIVRSDRGILAPADLRGRRIAVPQFTSAHYFLDIYLIANNLAPKDVTRVFLPAQEAAAAFRRGEVDAFALWDPALLTLAKEFGAKSKTFSAPGLQTTPLLLVGGREYVRRNPAVIASVLRALVRAERFAKEQPVNSKELMARSYNLTQGETDSMWPLYDFRVSLDQSLPFILENTARWEIGFLPSAQRPALPNYLEYIYLDGLLTVKPAAVTIIH